MKYLVVMLLLLMIPSTASAKDMQIQKVDAFVKSGESFSSVQNELERSEKNYNDLNGAFKSVAVFFEPCDGAYPMTCKVKVLASAQTLMKQSSNPTLVFSEKKFSQSFCSRLDAAFNRHLKEMKTNLGNVRDPQSREDSAILASQVESYKGMVVAYDKTVTNFDCGSVSSVNDLKSRIASVNNDYIVFSREDSGHHFDFPGSPWLYLVIAFVCLLIAWVLPKGRKAKTKKAPVVILPDDEQPTSVALDNIDSNPFIKDVRHDSPDEGNTTPR